MTNDTGGDLQKQGGCRLLTVDVDFFCTVYKHVKLKLGKVAINNLEESEKNVPLQPANEETRWRGEFIKGLEKAKVEEEKRL